MTDYSSMLKRTAIVYIITAITLPLSFLIRSLYARQLSVVDYGLFYGMFAVFGFLGFFRDWGLVTASHYFAQKYLSAGDKGKIKTLFFLNQSFQLLLSLIIGSILFLLKSFIISNFYHNEGNIDSIFTFFIIYWVLDTIFKSNITFFNIFNEQGIAKASEMFFWVLSLLASMVGFIFLKPFQVPTLAYLSSALLLSCITTYIFVIRHIDIFRSRLYKKKDLIKEVFTYSSSVMISNLSSMVLSQIDIFLIQLILGAESVAYYSSGFATANILSLLTSPLIFIVIPIFARLWHDKKLDELQRLMNVIMNNLLLFILPFSLFFFIFPAEIISIVFGSNYLGSIDILRIISISIIVKMFYVLFIQYLWSTGEAKITTIITIFSSVINIVLDLILIKIYGNVGAAIATSAVYLLIMYLCVRSIKTIKLKLDLKNNIKILFASIIFAFAGWALKVNLNIKLFFTPLFNFLVESIIIFSLATMLYVTTLFVLKVINKEKLLFIRRLLVKR